MLKAQSLIVGVKMVFHEQYIKPSNEWKGKSCPEEHSGNLTDDKAGCANCPLRAGSIN